MLLACAKTCDHAPWQVVGSFHTSRYLRFWIDASDPLLMQTWRVRACMHHRSYVSSQARNATEGCEN
eukprot:1478447-Amphidinium_carterae.1